MNRYRKLCFDTIIFAFGTFGSKLLVFLLMPLYTALLSPAEYGIAELISGTASLIMPVACVGITNGIFRFTADRATDQKQREEILSSGVALLIIGLLIFLAVGIPIATFGSWKWQTVLIILYVLTANIQAVFAQYVRAMDRTRLFAVQGILNTVVTIALNLVFLAVFNLGVVGYILSVIVANLLTAVFLFLHARLWESLSIHRVKKERLRELAFFSMPLVPTSICWLLTALSDRYLVTWFCGDAVNGIYSAAYKIPTIVNLSASVFLQAWQFSAVAESDNREGCRRFYGDVFGYYLSLVFVGTSLLIISSGFLTDLLLNSAYREASRFMPTLLCASAIEAIVAFLASVYLVQKRSWNSFFTAVSGCVLNLILNFMMIPTLGALGAALATLAGYGLVYFLRMADVPRFLAFELYSGRQAFSIFLLLAQASLMTFEPPNFLLFSAIFAFCICAVNLPTLLIGIRAFLYKKGAI